ncbi:MAG: hypothetical protein IJW14_00085 [Oscillospiraceae bacterium]|nr:hypothetical protein [Oscillospiraceae bacterium]
MKKGICILLALAAVAVLITVVACNVSFGMSTDAYAAMSIAFDRQAMASADRIVVTAKGTEIEITDPELIAQVTQQTAAATHMKFSCPEDRRIDIYCGDRLIRSMGWSTCCDMVNVYDTNGTHWVISVEGIEEGGSVYLSEELRSKLNALINGL